MMQARAVPVVLAAMLLLGGCAKPQGQITDEWRLKSLEETVLKLQDRVAALERSPGPPPPGNPEEGRSEERLSEPAPGPGAPGATSIPSVQTAPRTPARPAAKAPEPPARPSSSLPQGAQGAQGLYNEALRLAEADKPGPAREKFKTFIAQYPGHQLMPNALYWLGETYYQDRQFAEAILTFKEVREKYPKHQKASDALLKLGYSYERMGDKNNARFYLEALREEYPGSSAARLAERKLKDLR